MADQDRLPVKCPDLRLVVVHNLRQAEALDRFGRLAQLFDVPLLAWPFGCRDVVAPIAEIFGERVPAARREPGAVNQHQRTAACGTLHDEPPSLLVLQATPFRSAPLADESRGRAQIERR